MSSVTLEEAQARLPELLAQLQPGEAITITDQGQPLAQMKKAERTSWPCQAGSAKGRTVLRWRVRLVSGGSPLPRRGPLV